MKKFALMMLAGLLLAGCASAAPVQSPESADKQPAAKHELPEREFIVRDSVDEPLPPEAQDIEAMPERFESQQIPNANLHDPIVITKMPYGEKEKP